MFVAECCSEGSVLTAPAHSPGSCPGSACSRCCLPWSSSNLDFQPQSHHLSELKDDGKWLFVITLQERYVMRQGEVDVPMHRRAWGAIRVAYAPSQHLTPAWAVLQWGPSASLPPSILLLTAARVLLSSPSMALPCGCCY